jgi:glycosyltransferase involved in cell wall biosynthesis
MRILMLTQFFPPVIGGEEQHVRNLSIQLRARGHQVAVATQRHPGAPDQETDEGVRVYRLPGTAQRAGWFFAKGGRRHAPPFPDPEGLWSLRRVISRERPEVVHAHNWYVYTYLPIKRWAGAPLVMTLHDYSLGCATKRLMFAGAPCTGPELTRCVRCSTAHYGLKGLPILASNWAASHAERGAVDRFLPVSRAVAAGTALAEAGLPFDVIPNFLPDALDENEIGCEHYLAQLPEADYLLFVGDLSRDKGVDVLLRAYEGLDVRLPLVLIGRRLPDTPTPLPAGAIMLHDWPHHAVMAAWRRSALGVVPSIWPDPCPTVALEAMASRRAIVASRMGGLIDQVVDGETGILVPPGDAIALRGALRRLLDDRSLRERMGQAGKAHVREFQSASVVPRIEHVYRQLCGHEPDEAKKMPESSRAAGNGANGQYMTLRSDR